MGWKAVGLVLMLTGMILITLMVSWNVNEVKTVDLSGIKADRVIAGTNLIKPDFQSESVAGFFGKSYEVVMVGVEDKEIGRIAYLGLAGGQYYKATEEFSLGTLQKVNEVRIDNETLLIVCGKNVVPVIIFSALSLIFLIGGGLALVFLFH